MKEATARIKFNHLLEAAGWRFFANQDGSANIVLEPSVTLKLADLDNLGENSGHVSPHRGHHQPATSSRARAIPHPRAGLHQGLRALEPVCRLRSGRKKA